MTLFKRPIPPQLGMNVLYFLPGDPKPHHAVIVDSHEPKEPREPYHFVALQVSKRNGEHFYAYMVALVQEADDPLQIAHCRWPEYTIVRAAAEAMPIAKPPVRFDDPPSVRGHEFGGVNRA